MSKLSIENVEHIAKLSRLSLTDAEKKKFSEQLSSILEYVGQLNEIDTNNIEITAQVTGLKNVYIVDEVTNPEAPTSLLDNSPELEARAIKVPGVFN